MLRITSISLIMLFSCSAYASDSEWFAAVKLSLGKDNIDNISHGGTIGTGTLINGEIDGQIRDEKIDDYTAGLGFAVGKRIGNWTYEAEYIYRYRTDWDVVTTTPSIQTITNVFSDTQTQTLMFNLIRRGVISQDWSWEFGAGIGLVVNDIEASYIERATTINPEMEFADNSRDTDFTYNVLAGVTRDLGGPWTLNIRYRYIDLGELKAGPFPSRSARLSADHTSHEVQFALEREF
ncbi:MAG: opacity protein-like surface antigen [Candidatus Azotimanducaceae bacterium]|jgi:opacity protein-like surface antigen